jgi:hypothetical protein
MCFRVISPRRGEILALRSKSLRFYPPFHAGFLLTRHVETASSEDSVALVRATCSGETQPRSCNVNVLISNTKRPPRDQPLQNSLQYKVRRPHGRSQSHTSTQYRGQARNVNSEEFCKEFCRQLLRGNILTALQRTSGNFVVLMTAASRLHRHSSLYTPAEPPSSKHE